MCASRTGQLIQFVFSWFYFVEVKKKRGKNIIGWNEYMYTAIDFYAVYVDLMPLGCRAVAVVYFIDWIVFKICMCACLIIKCETNKTTTTKKTFFFWMLIMKCISTSFWQMHRIRDDMLLPVVWYWKLRVFIHTKPINQSIT